MLKFVNFFLKVLLIFVCKTKNNQKNIVGYFYCLSEILAKHYKIKTFSSKTARNKFLYSILIKFTGCTDPNTTNTVFVDTKGGFFTSNSVESVL